MSFTDRELDQIDRAAERQAAAEAWAQKPTKHLGKAAPIEPSIVTLLNQLGFDQRYPETQEARP